MKLVFLLEEPSMKYLLDELLPKILPQDVAFQTIPHKGKSDLRKSIPRKLNGWNEPDVRFVVVHDQDNKDCVELKQQLAALCNGCGKDVLVRIACQELEAWYFGDIDAVAQAYGEDRIAKARHKKQFRIPDKIPNPKEALLNLIPEHQQIMGAKLVAKFMDIDRNESTSFRHFVSGVRRFAVQ